MVRDLIGSGYPLVYAFSLLGPAIPLQIENVVSQPYTRCYYVITHFCNYRQHKAPIILQDTMETKGSVIFTLNLQMGSIRRRFSAKVAWTAHLLIGDKKWYTYIQSYCLHAAIVRSRLITVALLKCE